MASFRLLVLAVVRDYIGKHGVSPSIGEIAAELNASRTRVREALKSLARDGLLLRRPGPRGLALPTEQDEAVRKLRSMGWRVNADAMTLGPPGFDRADSTLLPPAELTYPSRSTSNGVLNGEQGSQGTEAGARRAS